MHKVFIDQAVIDAARRKAAREERRICLIVGLVMIVVTGLTVYSVLNVVSDMQWRTMTTEHRAERILDLCLERHNPAFCNTTYPKGR